MHHGEFEMRGGIVDWNPRILSECHHDERDHRRSGWSLFGRKRQQPQQQPSYAPPPSSNRTTQQLRQTQSAQPQPQDPQLGHSDDDDLEIPSFLRRLAN